ncbi:MFS transporter [Sneathiella litorea]|uniref:MFS transporter n=1 Tax=Sneathiella litorea TaxID=2606216 RepID=A0A6L8W4A6_9PROT|nr:MFS transporter [Sneathiella litorea]MZR29334.1 MFS transporter [Sneathiella litorea]
MGRPKKTEFVPMAIGVLLLCFLMGLVGRFAFENFPNLVAPLSKEFDWTRGTVASIYSFGAVVTGLTGPIVGILFDRYGPRSVYGVGILSAGAGLIFASFATNIWLFYMTISLLVGFSASCCGNVPNAAMASRWFRAQIPLALAIIYSSMGAGTLLGLSLSQIFIENYGWRQAELLLGLIVLSILLVILFLPWRRITAGSTELSRPQTTGAEEPEIEWTMSKAIRTWPFWGLASVFFFTGNGMFSVVIQAVTYLIEVGFTPIEASVNYGLSGLLIPVGMLGAGYLALKIGLFKTAMFSYVITIVAVICIWLLDRSDHLIPLYGFIIFFGLSMGSRGPMIGSISSLLFRGRNFGTIYGGIAVGGGFGMASGSFFSGLIYDLTASYDAVFLYSIICLVIGASPFILIKEIRNQSW